MMDDFLKLIKSRRSIRVYSDREVAEDVLLDVLTAGAYAPSARNAQALTFTAVCSDGILSALNDAVKLFLRESNDQFIMGLLQNPSFRFYMGAPVLVIISASESAYRPREDTGCAAENIMLAAHSAGLASCWINQLSDPACDAPGIRALLSEIGVPAEDKIYGCVALGYSDKMPAELPRKGNKIQIVK